MAFQFLASWVSHLDFNKFVCDIWRHDTNIASNITSLTTSLKKWNFDVFGHIIRRKRTIAYRIGKVQAALDCICSRYLLNLESKLHLEYEKILDEEELVWKQKSRMDGVHFGDRNTKLFHNKALIR
ncbi:hypothetical protein ES288_D05G393200v1 [Gossypium darwinii]|uniref:Uncharacterized protein n=1 Tax=Gossypium darwinii TaxID=34276 RepID=A0A5D2CT45_GOSDA|nr:hypothetical protein ES288_D05G393200v1 [Gossypium darwinii]